MANIAGGSVVWILDAETGQFESAVISARNKAKQLGDDVEKVGKQSFSSMASNASNSFNSIADGIANITKKIALITVGAGGIGSVFLKSAADLQQTAKSMEVLTGNVEVANTLFAQLADFAAKTPFEFPQIAKAGKTLLGFGISSDQVFTQVQMLGDIAAATGADFNSLAVVFGQVNATGKLMGQDALQLINNNIPITSILAKKLGTNVQDVKKRMEEGTISAQLFNDALREQTQAGGFAFKGTEVLAQSLNGRLSTLKDTVLEFGRNLLGVKVDPKLGLVIEPGGLFDRISNALPVIIAKLQELGPKFAEGFKWIIDNGKTVMGIVAAIATAFVGFKILAIITPLIATFMTALAGGAGVAGAALAVVGGPITLIGAAVVALAAGIAFLQVKFNILGKAVKFLEPVLNIIKGVFSDLWTSIKELGAVLAKELAPVFEFVGKHAEVFKKIMMVIAAVALAPLILAVGAFIASMKILAVVIGFIADHFNVIKKIVIGVLALAFAPFIIVIGAMVLLIRHAGDIIDWFGGVFRKVGSVIGDVVSAIAGFFQDMFNIVKTVFTAIWKFVSPILDFIKNLFIIVFGSILLVVLTVLTVLKNIIVTAFNFYYGIISAVLGFIWNVVTTVWNAIFTVISTVIGWIWDRIVTAFNFYKDIIVGAFTAVYDFVTMIWDKIYGAVTSVVQKIIDFFRPAATWLLDKGKAIVQGLIDGIKSLAGAVWDGIKFVADKIGDFFKGAAGWLYETGKAIVQGMINGIKDMVKGVKDAAGEIGDAVKNKVKNLLGIHSPSKVFQEYGMNVGQGFIRGIDRTQGLVDAAMGRLTNTDMLMAPAAIDFTGTGGAKTGNTVINQTNNIYSEMDMEQGLRDLSWRLQN